MSHGVAAAQDSVPDLPNWLVVTTGVELDPSRGAAVALPTPSPHPRWS